MSLNQGHLNQDLLCKHNILIFFFGGGGEIINGTSYRNVYRIQKISPKHYYVFGSTLKAVLAILHRSQLIGGSGYFLDAGNGAKDAFCPTPMFQIHLLKNNSIKK